VSRLAPFNADERRAIAEALDSDWPRHDPNGPAPQAHDGYLPSDLRVEQSAVESAEQHALAHLGHERDTDGNIVPIKPKHPQPRRTSASF
jgi:hypothetical protein